MELFTNHPDKHDYLRFALEAIPEKATVYIATAFFSNSQFIKHLVKKEATVYLIVRLGEATSGPRLAEVLQLPNVFIRFFTDSKFHPKYYIVNDERAFVGSSNLTNAGLVSNHEVNIGFTDEETVAALSSAFQLYWACAEVLTVDSLSAFSSVQAPDREISNYSDEVEKKVGKVDVPSASAGSAPSRCKEDIFVSEFLRQYQVFIKKHEEISKIYAATGLRAAPRLPLRIEIDRFFNWVRDNYAYGENFKGAPVLSSEALMEKITPLVHEYCSTDDRLLRETEASTYPALQRALQSPELITSMEIDGLFDALTVVWLSMTSSVFSKEGCQLSKKASNPL